MFEFYNPNPSYKKRKNGKWKKPDCVLRALSKALDLSWEETFKVTVEEALKQFTVQNDNDVYKAILLRNGYEYHAVPAGRKPTVNEFAEEHPNDMCVLSVANHLVYADSGKFYDTGDWSGSCKVYSYYIKKA